MLLALSGVTGIGKSYFKEKLVENLNFRKVNTIRTRPIRTGEKNGVDGIFITDNELDKLKKQNKIVYDFTVFGGRYAYLKDEIFSDDNMVFEMHYTMIDDWKKIKPDIIIAIDSLASKSVERISSSVQLSDTGIIPGAGVGNKRRELSKDTLGVPVIAIGIPTVLDFATIVSEGLDLFIENLQDKAMSNEYLNQLHDRDNYEEVKSALNIGEYNMIVTPKEIDDLVDNMKDIVAKGINIAIS